MNRLVVVAAATVVAVVVVWGRSFSFLRPAVGSTPPPVEWGTVVVHSRAALSEYELTTHSFISDVWNKLNFLWITKAWFLTTRKQNSFYVRVIITCSIFSFRES